MYCNKSISQKTSTQRGRSLYPQSWWQFRMSSSLLAIYLHNKSPSKIFTHSPPRTHALNPLQRLLQWDPAQCTDSDIHTAHTHSVWPVPGGKSSCNPIEHAPGFTAGDLQYKALKSMLVNQRIVCVGEMENVSYPTKVPWSFSCWAANMLRQGRVGMAWNSLM